MAEWAHDSTWATQVGTGELSEEERGKMATLAARPKSAQALALRVCIVLRCAAGLSNTALAREQGVTGQTFGKWRRRFLHLLR